MNKKHKIALAVVLSLLVITNVVLKFRELKNEARSQNERLEKITTQVVKETLKASKQFESEKKGK